MSEIGEAAVARRLEDGFAPLGKRVPSLPGRVARFVATGEDAAVLLELNDRVLGENPLVLGSLERNAELWVAGDQQHLSAFFALLRDETFAAEPRRLVRLGLALAATAPRPLYPYWHGGTERCPDWFRILMVTASLSYRCDAALTRRTDFGVMTVERVLAVLAEEGLGPLQLFDYLFACKTGFLGDDLASRMPGIDDYLRREPNAVAAAWSALDADARVNLIGRIHAAGAATENVATLVAGATGHSKRVREAAAAALARTDGAAVRNALEPIFRGSATDAKVRAVELLATASDGETRSLLERLRDAGSKNVSAAAAAALAMRPRETPREAPSDLPGKRFVALDESVVDLPPLRSLENAAPFPEELLPALRRAAGQWYAFQPNGLPADATVDAVISLADGRVRQPPQPLWWFLKAPATSDHGRSFAALLADPRVTLVHLLRLYNAFNFNHPGTPIPRLHAAYPASVIDDAFRRRMFAEAGDLRNIVALHAYAGLSADEFVRRVLFDEPWEQLDESLRNFAWPFLAANLPLLESLLPPRDRRPLVPPERFVSALAWLPKVPKRFFPALMRLGIGSAATNRREARALLAATPDLDARIAAFLDDSDLESRAQAALWLGERKARAFAPAIGAAFERERSEKTRAAYLKALVALDADIAPYAGEATLLAQARRGLAKTGIKGLEWFPFDVLPAVRWANGEPVPSEIVRWWIVLANTLKDPAGSTLLEFYFDRLDPADAAALGTAVLSLFIDRDTVHPPESEAIAYAQRNAARHQKTLAYLERDVSLETAYAQLKAGYLEMCLHTASANRGILALATRVPGPVAAARVRDFVKCYGSRTSQAKSLLTMLSANPAPEALAAVLATANGCKQRSVQDHAIGLVRSMAAARGWTTEQLADNTIPTAGLNERGVLELACGAGRTYVAVPAEDGKLELRNPSGKLASSLPASRNQEDDEPLHHAKRALAAARKEVRLIVEQQTARLFDAMCLGRTWSPDDWVRLLARHPVVGPLCRRLVWLALDANGGTLASFRLLDDGSLTGPSDDPVALETAQAVKLAHRAYVSSELAQVWLRHYADYEVAPLFGQFSRPLLVPGAERSTDVAIVDRCGWTIGARRLRSAAAKRGYRPLTGEGGFVDEFQRRHPAADLAVVFEVEGVHAAENGAVARLVQMTFRRERAGLVPLSQVPPVLLSECWNDLHEIAAAGNGLDPTWKPR